MWWNSSKPLLNLNGAYDVCLYMSIRVLHSFLKEQTCSSKTWDIHLPCLPLWFQCKLSKLPGLGNYKSLGKYQQGRPVKSNRQTGSVSDWPVLNVASNCWLVAKTIYISNHDQPTAKFKCNSWVSTSRGQSLCIFVTQYVELNILQ